jgi:hypothetical protein
VACVTPPPCAPEGALTLPACRQGMGNDAFKAGEYAKVDTRPTPTQPRLLVTCIGFWPRPLSTSFVFPPTQAIRKYAKALRYLDDGGFAGEER